MEREFLRRLLPRLPGHPRLLLGPGDDAALLALAKEIACVVTTDMLMDGVDFELARHNPQRIGRKSLAVNCSADVQSSTTRSACRPASTP